MSLAPSNQRRCLYCSGPPARGYGGTGGYGAGGGAAANGLGNPPPMNMGGPNVGGNGNQTGQRNSTQVTIPKDVSI